ncbi:MAG: hypothetical protein WA364_28205 [Candidatus Nitrosopolaris sp.]
MSSHKNDNRGLGLTYFTDGVNLRDDRKIESKRRWRIPRYTWDSCFESQTGPLKNHLSTYLIIGESDKPYTHISAILWDDK